MFQMTCAGGMAFAFPDVCWTPAGPALVPYPNLASGACADPDTAVDSVMVCGMPALKQTSVITFSQGDEAGLGGIFSGEIMGQATFITASIRVMIKGVPATRLTGRNGAERRAAQYRRRGDRTVSNRCHDFNVGLGTPTAPRLQSDNSKRFDWRIAARPLAHPGREGYV
ncbi:DUF4150 domain-containing protein [Paraburkholderia sediminicola]|uniref:DUF4150 domain-containing protein n=1 Tax=Paraburkholderia sediminicola TaxID=458836 RepID=UPI0038B6C4C8